MGGRTDIQEHLNRISKGNPSNMYSAMTKHLPDSRAGVMSQDKNSRVASRELANRIETASDGNAYALVPKRNDDDLLSKTYQSFKLQ